MVCFGGTSYHGKYENIAKQHYFGNEAERCIMTKFNIPSEAMMDIDWETIRRVTRSLPLQQRATKAKFMYRWNYNKVRGHLFEEEDNETCSLCGEATEMNSHITSLTTVAWACIGPLVKNSVIASLIRRDAIGFSLILVMYSRFGNFLIVGSFL